MEKQREKAARRLERKRNAGTLPSEQEILDQAAREGTETEDDPDSASTTPVE